MEKTVTIDNKELKFKTSAALPRLYRIKFGKDLFGEIQKLEKNKDNYEVLENLAYLMNWYADNTITPDVTEWLEQFENTLAIINASKDILELWGLETKTTSSRKKA